MDRKSAIKRIATIVLAPAAALEALEVAKGKSMVGWTRSVDSQVDSYFPEVPYTFQIRWSNGIGSTLVQHFEVTANGFRSIKLEKATYEI